MNSELYILFIILVIGTASWRISHLFVNEEGPLQIFVRVRKFLGIGHDENNFPNMWPAGYLPQMFSCILCFSLNLCLLLWAICWFFSSELIYFLVPFSAGAVAMWLNGRE